MIFRSVVVNLSWKDLLCKSAYGSWKLLIVIQSKNFFTYNQKISFQASARNFWACRIAIYKFGFAVGRWFSNCNFHFSFLVQPGRGENTGPSRLMGPIIGGPFTLIDTENHLVTEKNFLGNWVLLYFGYTSSPDVGPEQVQMMAKAIDTLGLWI